MGDDAFPRHRLPLQLHQSDVISTGFLPPDRALRMTPSRRASSFAGSGFRTIENQEISSGARLVMPWDVS